MIQHIFHRCLIRKDQRFESVLLAMDGRTKKEVIILMTAQFRDIEKGFPRISRFNIWSFWSPSSRKIKLEQFKKITSDATLCQSNLRTSDEFYSLGCYLIKFAFFWINYLTGSSAEPDEVEYYPAGPVPFDGMPASFWNDSAEIDLLRRSYVSPSENNPGILDDFGRAITSKSNEDFPLRRGFLFRKTHFWIIFFTPTPKS